MTDWIPHNGGPCPVPNDTMVDLKWLGNEELDSFTTHRAGDFYNFWIDGIIACYRLNTPKPTLEDRVAALEDELTKLRAEILFPCQ